MKVTGIVARWLFVLCLPLLLLTASVSLAANCGWLYSYGFEKYDVSRTTGLAEPELEKAKSGLIHYFNSGEEPVNITVTKDGQAFQLFNDREIAHLRDVKALFHLVYWIALGTGLYALAYAGFSLWRRDGGLWRGLFWGGCLTLAAMAALGIGIVFDFDSLFLQLHLLSFANDFWMLDPTRDYLIMLFPRGFWYDAALFCALGTGVAALVLGGIGWWRMRKRRNVEAAEADS